MTAKPVRLHPDAVDEMVAAAEWYEARSADAANVFREELERIFDLIVDSPQRWPTYLGGTRRIVMHRFPFLVVYRESTEVIDVFAVAHGHRRRGYWLQRMT